MYNCATGVICYFVPNVVSRDIQARRGALRLVDEAFHEVLLALSAVCYLMVDINVGTRLDRCVANFLCNRTERRTLTWTLL